MSFPLETATYYDTKPITSARGIALARPPSRFFGKKWETRLFNSARDLRWSFREMLEKHDVALRRERPKEQGSLL